MTPHETIERRRFDEPDDKLDFRERGQIEILKMRDGTAGMHAVLRPGWKWTVDEKPLLGNPETCPMPHTGYCISGRLSVTMVASGDEVQIGAGDFFEIPSGHDAYVVGDETCELVLFQAPEPPVH